MDDKRRYPRYPFKEAVGYENRRGEYQGSIGQDVSRGGVCLTVNEFVPVGAVLEVNMFVGMPPRVVLAQGKVVWVREIAYGDRFEIGVEFFNPVDIIDKLKGYFQSLN